MPNRILTIDDLYDFYSKQNQSCNFSSEESGYQLLVRVPTQFEGTEDEPENPTIAFYPVRAFHIGANRNHSSVTKDAAEKAMKNMAYKPLLANFCEYEDENGETVRDFTSHDSYEDEDGNTVYIERQIGCITADEPYFKKYRGKEYVCVNVAIPYEYTDANEIIARKKGTKVSVELLVNELRYDAKTKILELTDVEVQGLTCLGYDVEKHRAVEEGMRGSKLTIGDFTANNNGFELDDALMVDIQDRLEALENACFNIDDNSKKGGKTNMFNDLLAKYGKTVDDIDFDYENMSDEELESKFEEEFGKCGEETEKEIKEEKADGEEDNSKPVEEPEESEEADGIEEPTAEEDTKEGSEEDASEDETAKDKEAIDEPEEDDDEDIIDDESCDKKKCAIEVCGFKREFELSLNAKIEALYKLVNDAYSDDDTYYSVDVFESYIIMHDWWNGSHFKQSYQEENEVFTLVGERVEVFSEFLTKEEKEELDTIRSDYSVISEELSKYKKAEEDAQKEEVLSDEAYSCFAEEEEFIQLRAESENYSVEELRTKADLLFAKLVKSQKTYSAKEKQATKKVAIYCEKESEETYKPYGDLFD